MIPKILSGDTFRKWIYSTNQAIDDLNLGSSSAGTANGLVRYDSSGLLTFTEITTTDLTLSGTHVNAISNDYTTFDANTLLTGIAVQDYHQYNNSRLWDEPANQNTNISLTTTSIDLDVETINIATITKNLFTVTANARFDQNLEIVGDLRIIGNQVSIATTELTVEDNIITLNKGSGLTPNGAGIEIEDGSGSIVGSITYNDSSTAGFDLSTVGGFTVTLVPRDNIQIDLDQDLSTVSSVEFANTQVRETLLIPYDTAPASTGLGGQIRYNSIDSRFEGHDGTVWGSLGGVSTPDGRTYLAANDTPHQLEFYANSNNLMTITETTIDLFSHAFENVSSNLFSSSLSTDLITANAAKIYVDETANDLWSNVHTIEVTSLLTQANVANLQVNTALLQANTTDLWANLTNVENTVFDLVNNPANLVNLQIGTVGTTAPGTSPTVVNVNTFNEPILDFTFPTGNTGVGISSVAKTANNEITVTLSDSSASTHVFDINSLKTITDLQLSINGDDYEIRAHVSGGVPTGQLKLYDPTSTTWIDVGGSGTVSPTANTTGFFGLRVTNNDLILDIVSGSDIVNVDDYSAYTFAVGIDFEVQDNHLIMKTN